MIDLILQNIPEDAPQILSDFILEKEQELQGKLYVQLSYKIYIQNGKYKKNVVVTIFCKQLEKTFPLPEFNNKPIKNIIDTYKENLTGIWKMALGMVNVQKLLNKAFEKLEAKHKGTVKILIYNQENEGKKDTIFELKYPENTEKHTFETFLQTMLANPENIDLNELM